MDWLPVLVPLTSWPPPTVAVGAVMASVAVAVAACMLGLHRSGSPPGPSTRKTTSSSFAKSSREQNAP